jgi:hypothetical protein
VDFRLSWLLLPLVPNEKIIRIKTKRGRTAPFVFVWCWGWDPRPHTCWATTLPRSQNGPFSKKAAFSSPQVQPRPSQAAMSPGLRFKVPSSSLVGQTQLLPFFKGRTVSERRDVRQAAAGHVDSPPPRPWHCWDAVAVLRAWVPSLHVST